MKMKAIGLTESRSVEGHGEWQMYGEFVSRYTRMWWETPADLPCLGEKQTDRVKAFKEKQTDLFVKAMANKLRNIPAASSDKSIWCDKFKAETKEFARTILNFKDEYLDIIFGEGFISSTSSFIKEAKKFAPGIKLEDVFQAIRNVWIMNSIQVFLDKEVGFSPSVFAYSMLYPYTDNYLDSTAVKYDEKAEIGRRLGERLSGRAVDPCSSYESDIFKLVGIIEDQYPRMQYPEVYKSILGIHAAQQSSLLQQGKRTVPYEMDILGISFQKGGMSVLTDAYLVSGNLDREAAEFMFGFGVILQLADDLQDVSVDAENGHMTLFSQIAGKWFLDNMTSKLLSFISGVLDSAKPPYSPAFFHLKELIKYNCNFLVLQAVAKNSKLYSAGYLKEIEEYSIYSFKYMRKLYDKLRKEYASFERRKDGGSMDDIVYGLVEGF